MAEWPRPFVCERCGAETRTTSVSIAEGPVVLVCPRCREEEVLLAFRLGTLKRKPTDAEAAENG